MAAACGGEPPRTEHETPLAQIDTTPATLDAAVEVLTAIDELQKTDPAAAQAALLDLQPTLDALNGLVARVVTDSGRTVSFYEPSPGMIGISERGAIGEPRALEDERFDASTTLELYQRLTGGAEPPVELIAAQERAVERELANTIARADELLDEGASCTDKTVDEHIGTTASGLTAGHGPWWRDNVCYKSGDFRGCHPNWGGGGYAYASAKTSFFQVAPYSGNSLSVRFQYENSTRFTDAAFPGEWLGWWWHSDSFWDCWCYPICACGTRDYNRRKHRWDILNASGDGFHWTYAFKWSCGSVPSCDTTP